MIVKKVNWIFIMYLSWPSSLIEILFISEVKVWGFVDGGFD